MGIAHGYYALSPLRFCQLFPNDLLTNDSMTYSFSANYHPSTLFPFLNDLLTNDY